MRCRRTLPAIAHVVARSLPERIALERIALRPPAILAALLQSVRFATGSPTTLPREAGVSELRSASGFAMDRPEAGLGYRGEALGVSQTNVLDDVREGTMRDYADDEWQTISDAPDLASTGPSRSRGYERVGTEADVLNVEDAEVLWKPAALPSGTDPDDVSVVRLLSNRPDIVLQDQPLLASLQSRLAARLQSTLEILDARLRAATGELSSASAEREKTGVLLYAVLEEQKKLRKSCEELGRESEERSTAREMAESRNSADRSKADTLRSELHAKETEAEALRKELEKLELKLNESAAGLDAERDKLRLARAQADRMLPPPDPILASFARRLESALTSRKALLSSLPFRFDRARGESAYYAAQIAKLEADTIDTSHDIRTISLAHAESARKLEKRNLDLARLQSSMEGLEATLTAKSAQLDRLAADLDAARLERSKISAALDSLDMQVSDLYPRLAHAESARASHASELLRVKIDSNEQQTLLASAEREAGSLAKMELKVREKVASIRSELSLLLHRPAIQDRSGIAQRLRNRAADFAGQCNAVEKIIELAVADLEKMVYVVDKAEMDVEEARQRLSDVESRHRECEESLKLLAKALDSSKKNVAKAILEREKLGEQKRVLQERRERSSGAREGLEGTIETLKSQLTEARRLLGIHAKEFEARSAELLRLSARLEERRGLIVEVRERIAELENKRADLRRLLDYEDSATAQGQKALDRARGELERTGKGIWMSQLAMDAKNERFLSLQSRATESLHALEAELTITRSRIRDAESARAYAAGEMARLGIAASLWRQRISACEAMVRSIDPNSGKGEIVALQKALNEARNGLERAKDERERIVKELGKAVEISAQIQASVKSGASARTIERRISEVKGLLKGYENEWKRLEAGELKVGRPACGSIDRSGTTTEIASKSVAANDAKSRLAKLEQGLSAAISDLEVIDRECGRLASRKQELLAHTVFYQRLCKLKDSVGKGKVDQTAFDEELRRTRHAIGIAEEIGNIGAENNDLQAAVRLTKVAVNFCEQ